MPPRPEDICPRPDTLPPQATQPLIPGIFPATVYRCASPAQADALLGGEQAGYVYSRDGHPNADLLAEKCRQLHGAERAAVCSSGMAALAAPLLAALQQGDHVVISNQLYGRSQVLFQSEAPRLGIGCALADTCDLASVERAFTPRTRLLVVETITNPLLRVCDLAALVRMAHERGARLLVDNTFAGPTICRPFEFGADFVIESLTKIMNGHSDVCLGLVCGPADIWPRLKSVLSTWGYAASPFDCWLAARGLGTLALRSAAASANALIAARFLAARPEVEAVAYPGLDDHPDRDVAARQFTRGYGSMVTFTLAGGLAAVDRFIAAAPEIPFCPSLADISTTLSHPASTSHRALSPAERAALGIGDGAIRLSVGVESAESITAALAAGLRGAAAGGS